MKKLFFCVVCLTLTFGSLASQECQKTEFTAEQQRDSPSEPTGR